MLYVFLEGPDDKTYFDKVFGCYFSEYKIIMYANRSNIDIQNFLNTIPKIPNSDYLFFGDEDGKGIDNRRSELLEKYKISDGTKLFVVQYEIESWYYAGVTQQDCKKIKLSHFQHDTNKLSKEQLYSKMNKPSERKIIMAKMLECYSRDLAQTRNKSFLEFYGKIIEKSVAVS